MTDATLVANYSGRPYELRLRIWTAGTGENSTGPYSYYNFRLYAVSKSGYGSSDGTASSWEVWIHTYYYSGNASLNFASGGDYAGKEITIATGTTDGVYHGSDGYMSMTVRGRHGGGGSLFGEADTGWVTYYADRIPRTPPAPSPLGIDEVTTTSFRYRFSSNGDGGAGILTWDVQYATNAAFTGASSITSTGTSTLTGLAPGTKYYVRSRGNNSAGAGAWSTVSEQTTLPADPPGVSVASSLSGTSAVITLTPPGGVSGVNSYTYETRPLGGSSTSKTIATNTDTIGSLTPSASYQYRAKATIGSYDSPWSSWVTVVQSNPNTNPGDYYDGASAAKPDLTYGWSGTPHASSSFASGKVPTGWRTFAQSATVCGGTGAVHQVTGGYVGAFAARLIFFSDATAAGLAFGNDPVGAAAVTPNSTYYGLIHAQLPARSQRLRAGIAWLTSANAPISITWSPDARVLAASSSTWGEFAVSGVAPATAAKAVVVIGDVAGTGWSLWLSGDEIRADGTLIGITSTEYFDGASPTTPQYRRQWNGVPNASTSTQFANTAFVNALQDPDCPPPPTPPAPPSIDSDCIEENLVWTRLLYQISATEVPEAASVVPTLVLTTGAAAERQVRLRWLTNPTGTAPEQLDFNAFEAEMIVSYIPAYTQMTLDGILERASAIVASAPSQPANHLLYGTDGTPATWPELRCNQAYVVALDRPQDAAAGNLSTRILLTTRS